LPVVQELPLLGIYGQGVREAQIYALLGQEDDAYAALGDAIQAGYRTSLVADNWWTLETDPYFESMRDDDRFIAILNQLDALNSVMYDRVIEAEASGDWEQLTDLAGSI
jgi:hypothetical protein